MNSFFSGYLIIQDSDINRIYLKLCERIGAIISKKEFIELYPFEWRPFENLLSLDPDYPEVDWEYEGQKICGDFFSKIQEIFIRNGEEKSSVFVEDHQRILEISNYLAKYEKMKKDRDSIWLKRIESEANKLNNRGFRITSVFPVIPLG